MLCLSRDEICPRPINEAVSAAVSTAVRFSVPRDWRYSRSESNPFPIRRSLGLVPLHLPLFYVEQPRVFPSPSPLSVGFPPLKLMLAFSSRLAGPPQRPLQHSLWVLIGQSLPFRARNLFRRELHSPLERRPVGAQCKLDRDLVDLRSVFWRQN